MKKKFLVRRNASLRADPRLKDTRFIRAALFQRQRWDNLTYAEMDQFYSELRSKR